MVLKVNEQEQIANARLDSNNIIRGMSQTRNPQRHASSSFDVRFSQPWRCDDDEKHNTARATGKGRAQLNLGRDRG
jgi:hypothetical protein